MKKLFFIIGILTAVFVSSCKKDTSVKDDNVVSETECFYFEAVEAGATIGMVQYNADSEAPNVSLEYSYEKTNWFPFIVAETQVTLANAGDKVYIRANGTNKGFHISNKYNYDHFTSTKGVKVGGNIMFLLDGTGEKRDLDSEENSAAFAHLFRGMTYLQDASSLVLPAMKLPSNCYWEMFEFCTSLKKAPKLPATTLGLQCYLYMFSNCSSLTVAPELPATVMYECCYGFMFKGCSSLTVAPELPSTELCMHCYWGMFEDCTSLTTAPKLPATTLAEECYQLMFHGCTSLQSIEVSFAKWKSNDNQNTATEWVRDVAPSGTFKCPAGLDVSQMDDDHIPAGWTVVTK